MSKTDSSITFSTELDNKKLEKDLNGLEKEIESREKALTELEKSQTEAVKKREAAYKSLAKAQAALAESQGKRDALLAEQEPLIQQLDAVKAKLQDAQQQVQKYGEQWRSGVVGADTQQEKARDLVRELQAEYDELLAKVEKMDPSIQKANAALTEQEQTVKQQQAAWNEASREVQTFEETISQATTELNQAKEEAGGLVRKLAAARPSAERTGKAVEKMQKRLHRFSVRLGWTVSRALVFTAISQGLSSLKSWMSSAIKTNDEATAAIGRLKGALLTMAQPLIEVVIPAFTSLVNVLTNIVTVIAQLFSSLSGKTLKQSSEAAEALYEQTSALEGVGSAAEDASKSLAGFDEINKLSDGSASGSGSSGAIAPDFSALESAETPKWIEALTDNMDKVEVAAKTIGILIAGWAITSALESALNKITNLSSAGKVTIGFALATAGGTLLLDHVEALASGELDANSVESALRTVLEGALMGVGGASLISGITGAGFGLALQISLPLSLLITKIAIELSDEQGQAAVNNFKELMLALFTEQTLEESLGNLIFGEEQEKSIWDRLSEIFASPSQKLLNNSISMFKGLGDESAWAYVEEIAVALENGEPVGPIISEWFATEVAPWFTGTKWNELFSGGIVDGFSATWDEFSGWWDTNIGKWWRESVKPWFTKEKWEETLKGMKEALPASAKNMLNGVISTFEGAVNLIIKGINWLISQLNKVSFTIPKWVPSIGGKSFGFNIPSVSSVTIPRLATGAVVPPNREFMAVLGDNKTETEVVSPLSTMKQAMLEALRESGGTGSGTITVVVNLDGKEVARNQVKHINDMTRQAGKSVLLF